MLNRSPRRRLLFPVDFLCVIFLIATTSLSAEATFYEAYQTGLRMERAGNWAEALSRFREAARLNPTPARRVKTYGLNFLIDYDPYLHMAANEARLGMFDAALKHLEVSRAAKVTPPIIIGEVQRRIDLAKEKAEQPPVSTSPPAQGQHPATPTAEPAAGTAEPPRAGLLKVDSVPPGATVIVDGKELGVTPFSVSIPPGDHKIEWRRTGFQPAEDTVTLKSGETATTRVVLSAASNPPSEKAPSPVGTPAVKKVAPTATQPAPAQTPQISATPPVEISSNKEDLPNTQQHKEEKTSLLRSLKAPLKRWGTVGLLVVVGLLLFAATRRRNRAATTSTAAPPSQPTVITTEETPTHALPAETLAQSDATAPAPAQKTPTPVPLEEAMQRAQPLSEGVTREFGAYQLHGILGRGGMGTTYLAARARDGLPLAVKIPHEHLQDNKEFAQRFLREGSLGSTLHHPNIIRIYEAGVANNRPFIAMELIQGETLEARLRREGVIPVRAALEIARDIAVALDYARLKGIVHRDLKPENIMIMDRGGLKVMDYGIARIVGSPGLTATEAYLGTPAYSSPEATGGDGVDQQSDLYSLGIILYRMLNGEVPFRSKNVLEVLEMHRNRVLPEFSSELKIPESVFSVVKKLTAKKKEDRYENAEAFLIQLNQILNELE